MLIYDGLAVIGACVSIAFCGWCVLVALQTLRQFEEVKPRELPEVYDLPKWNQMNPIAKNANKELKKMYKGKMKGELV
jgi:hypothetical protein